MHRALRILAFLLAFPVFAATPPQSVDLDLSQTARAFRLQFAEGTTPLLRGNVKNAGTAYTVTGWTATLYLSATWDDTQVIAIPSTTTGATYFDFQMTGTHTSTNGVFTANIIATDGTATVEWQRGEVEIRPSPGSSGAGTITLSTPLSWSGYTYSNTGGGGPYRAGSNVVFTINGDGSANINADVTAGSGDVTGITSTDGSITVTNGTGPIPNVALPSTLPARNGSLLTAINAAALGGVLPAGYATTNSVAVAIAKAHDAATVAGGMLTLSGQQIGLATNAVRAAVSALYIQVDGDGRLGWSDPGMRPYMSVGYGAAPHDTTYPGVYFESNDGDTGGLRYLDSGTGFVQVKQGVADWSTVISYANIATYGSGFFAPLSTVTNLNASALTSGTVPDARFPATLPAKSGVNLTALNATQITSGTIPDIARLPASTRQPIITWTYRDLTWNTTAGAGWTGYEIETGASPNKRTFGLDAISAAAATDQTGTFKTDWITVPATFAAFKTTGAIKITWVSSQAVVGESELRGIRLIGSSDLTGANATDLYTDATVRDITTTGVPVAVSINRSAFASTTVPAYICVQIDASVEDGDKLAIISVEVLSE